MEICEVMTQMDSRSHIRGLLLKSALKGLALTFAEIFMYFLFKSIMCAEYQFCCSCYYDDVKGWPHLTPDALASNTKRMTGKPNRFEKTCGREESEGRKCIVIKNG
uniref:Uncharacterized protein n=1 Tax=Glossina austeni TaxID=7395 RepID=A0A1A9VA91_GLOAU